MHRSLLLLALALLLLVAPATPQTRRAAKTKRSPSPLSAREIAKRTLPSVVTIITEDENGKALTLGSGFQIRPGIIATNYHVIKDASQASATFQGGSPKYEIVGTLGVDKEHDLALLRLGGVVERNPYDAIIGRGNPLTEKLGLATTWPEIGDTVYVAGNPEGLEGTFSQGIISALRGNELIQITAPISHGSSGGPDLNGYGEVMVIPAGAVKGGQNRNFAIPISYLKSLIGRMTSSPVFLAKEPVPEWQLVNSSDSIEYYMSRAHITVTPERTLLAWLKNLPNNSPKGRAWRNSTIDALIFDKVDRSYAFSYSMEQYEFDCGHQKMRRLGWVCYDNEGVILFSLDFAHAQPPEPWETVPAASVQ